MLDKNFLWLINWYSDQYDGDSEHSFGIKISTLDNPGWKVKINIKDTILNDKIFQNISIERTENDWIFCKVQDGFFEGFCGTYNLAELILYFRNWAEL
jgi:hypothetical protein